MGFIFWMSTETFSSQNTFSWIEIVLRFLVPKISLQEMGFIHALIRKAGHVVEYFVLGLLLLRTFRGGSTSSWNWRWPFFAMIVVVLWAACDEFHQSFVPTRTASAVDVGIDAAGGILAQVVGALWNRYKGK
jgi:VanZ family protein